MGFGTFREQAALQISPGQPSHEWVSRRLVPAAKQHNDVRVRARPVHGERRWGGP